MGFLGSLFGKKKAPEQKRPATPASLSWRATTVTKETPSTVSFELDGTMAFKAGQFVLLRPNASMPWRAYSFSRSPKQTPLRLTVKAVQAGTVSVHLTSKLAAGDSLEVKGPFGHFVLPESFTRALFIAGGSGITPFLSMLYEQAEKGWPSPITLVDFNRSANEQILKAELDALAAGSGGKFTITYLVDDDAAVKGPPSKESLGALFGGVAEKPEVVAMCGPQPLMDLAREVVMQKFPAALVLEEKFTMSHDGDAGGATHQVEFMQDGKAKPFPVKDGEHVLSAARKAGLNLSAGCEMGACGVCRVKVLAGQINIPDDACLSDGEKADGYALVCVGTVKGNCRIEPAP
ncbi:MAG: iron-sulfur cluster-binding domain-containing protein [Archangium sp.]